MTHHSFIFTPGIWKGKGSITFSMAEDVLKFSTKWTVLTPDEGKIFLKQVIDINEFTEKMCNSFCLFNITPTDFEIELKNNIVGKVTGKGIISPKVIAWEFRRQDQDFEGFEIYELQEDRSYKMRAEFTSGDGLRTTVESMLSCE